MIINFYYVASVRVFVRISVLVHWTFTVLNIPARITNKTLRRLNFRNAQMTKFANVPSVTFELVFNSKCMYPYSDSDRGSPSLTEGTACMECSNSHPHQTLSWVHGNLWSFSMKAITEHQLHDVLINSRHSCKKYCLHNSTL